MLNGSVTDENVSANVFRLNVEELQD